MNAKTWYVARNSNDTQGLVRDEKTGANIAVTYDARNANLVAAAPDLLDALELCYSELNQLAFLSGDKLAKVALDKARAAIDKAKGGES